MAHTKKGNIENVASLVDVKYHNLHHFMSESPWNPNDVINEAAKLNYGLMKTHKEPIVLAIDETSFVKKGKNSAGVGPQYLGSLGKTANGQVVVMSSFVQGTNASLVAADLYLPEDFHSDADRMKKVGLDPLTHPFKTKTTLAMDQIERLLALKCKPDYIVADAGYGVSIDFREFCRGLNIKYILDIKENLKVWFKGADTQFVNQMKSVNSWQEYASTGLRQEVLVQSNKAQKPIIRKVTLIPVIVLDSETLNRIPQTLMVIEEPNVETKFKITNEPCELAQIEVLTKIAAHRYYIERSFQNAKQLFNLSGYQVRKYDALMKHIAMCIVLGYKYNLELYAAEQEVPYMSQNKLQRHFKAILTALCEPQISLGELYKAIQQAQENGLKNLALSKEYWANVNMPK